MLQVATFKLPDQQAAANDFLLKHAPTREGVSFNKEMLVVFYDDGAISPVQEIADICDMIKASKNVVYQDEVALYVSSRKLADLKEERSHLKTNSNKGRVVEVDNMIVNEERLQSNLRQGILTEEIKQEFAEQRIVTLERTITK